MKKILTISTFLLLILGFHFSTTVLHAADHKELKAFPAAKAGMQRFVISLPHKERGEEDAFKVELLPGKMMVTDGVNQFRLGTRIESRPLKGWGYTYYEITGKETTMSTRVGVPAGSQSIKSFVSGQPLMIRYNSRLPIVIYAPKGQLVKYRVWKANDNFTTVNEG